MYKFLKIVLIIFLWGVLIFSGVKIWDIGKEYFSGSKSYDDLADQYVSTHSTVPKVVATEPPEPLEDTEPTERVWDEFSPIDVNFDALLKKNSDVVGWLYSEGTVINYPVLQAEDNSFYLNRLLDKTNNVCGSLFLDCWNNSDFSHYQNIIYGHNMKNRSMFGTLSGYKKQSYYDAHPVMYLLTPAQDYKIVLIAGYVVPSVSDSYLIAENADERDALIQKALEKSTFKADVEILETDRLLTLSTCTSDYQNARYILLGVMREIGKYQVPVDISDLMTGYLPYNSASGG